MEGTKPVPTGGTVTSVHLYYTPLLIVLGCIGNALSVLVLMQSKLRRLSTCHYLTALAVSDSIFLLLQIPPWLDNMGVTDVFAWKGLCELFVYCSYVTCCLSSWLVAAFTVERFMAIKHPLQRPALCTPQRARQAVRTLGGAALLANAPVLRFAAAVDGHCQIDNRYMRDAATFNVCDTILSFSLPLLIIVILNTQIALMVVRNTRERRALLRTQSPGRVTRTHPSALQQNKITTMLLCVSTVFVIFNLPAYVIRLLAYAYDMNKADQNGFWSAAQPIAFMVFNTNFGINFILYCLSGQNFRKALNKRLPKCMRWSEQSNPARIVTFPRNRTPTVSTTLASNMIDAHSRARAALNTPQPRASTSHTVTIEASDIHSRPVLKRWKFDNSRQLQRQRTLREAHPEETYELQEVRLEQKRI